MKRKDKAAIGAMHTVKTMNETALEIAREAKKKAVEAYNKALTNSNGNISRRTKKYIKARAALLRAIDLELYAFKINSVKYPDLKEVFWADFSAIRKAPVDAYIPWRETHLIEYSLTQ
jgi:hypothetical protein